MRYGIFVFKHHIIVAADCDPKKLISREKAREILERGDHGCYALSSEFDNPLLTDEAFLLRASHDFRVLKQGMLQSFESGRTRGRIAAFVRVLDNFVLNILPENFAVLLQRRVAQKLLPRIFGGVCCILSIDKNRTVGLEGVIE